VPELKKAAVVASVVLAVLLLAVGSVYLGGVGPLGAGSRLLGSLFVYLTSHEEPRLTAGCGEPVTAIVWDFRGADTFYETSVFAMAIAAAYSLRRGARGEPRSGREGRAFTVIPRLVTRLLLPLTCAVAASVAAHGSSSPGGGFQAGSMLAVTGVLFTVVFTHSALNGKSLNPERALAIMGVGLLGVAATAFLPVLLGGHFMQNQPKADSPFGYPQSLGGFVLGGSLFLYNVMEFIAVAFGFLVAFSLLSLPERSLNSEAGGE